MALRQGKKVCKKICSCNSLSSMTETDYTKTGATMIKIFPIRIKNHVFLQVASLWLITGVFGCSPFQEKRVTTRNIAIDNQTDKSLRLTIRYRSNELLVKPDKTSEKDLTPGVNVFEIERTSEKCRSSLSNSCSDYSSNAVIEFVSQEIAEYWVCNKSRVYIIDDSKTENCAPFIHEP